MTNSQASKRVQRGTRPYLNSRPTPSSFHHPPVPRMVAASTLGAALGVSVQLYANAVSSREEVSARASLAAALFFFRARWRVSRARRPVCFRNRFRGEEHACSTLVDWVAV